MEKITFKKSGGDIFCEKYNTYVSGDYLLLLDNMEQFEKDYEECFGWIPSAEESKKAIEFVELFLANIGHQNTRNNTARCVSG